MEDAVTIILARKDAELVLRAIQVFLTALPPLSPGLGDSSQEETRLDDVLSHAVELRLVQSEDPLELQGRPVRAR